MKLLNDLTPSLLYSSLLQEEGFRQWCQPLCTPSGDTAAEDEEDASDDRRSTCATGLPLYDSSGQQPQLQPLHHRGSHGKLFDAQQLVDGDEDDDDDADPLPVREAKAERRIVRQKEALYTAMQVMHTRKERLYRAAYTEGRRQQELAREEVAAYGKELGCIEAVSQLTPSSTVEGVLARMQANPLKCEDIFDDVLREDALLREMHMAIVRTKLRHQVDTELESGHQHLSRACDVHLNNLDSGQGPH